MMVHHFRTLSLKNLIDEPTIANIGFVESCFGIQIGPKTGRKVVDYYHLVSFFYILIDHMGTDKSSSACQKDLHLGLFPGKTVVVSLNRISYPNHQH